MSLASAALGLAMKLQSSLRSSASRIPITLLVIGQSTEQGPIPLTDRAANPEAFVSARNPGFMQKRVVSNPNRGGWWPAVHEIMWDWGYDLDIFNAAVGGASLLDHIVGTLGARVNNFPYYQRRPSVGYPDLGDTGHYIQTPDNKIFNVTGGRKRQAYNDLPFEGAVGTSVLQDFVGFSQTTELSGAAVPDTSTVAVGGSIADGALNLTRVDAALYTSEANFLPGHDGSQPNLNWSGTLGERAAGRGFDPLGIITHANRLSQQAAPAERKIVYFSQGQSDLGASALGYQKPLMILANYFLRRGWTVVLGNTIFSPASAGSTVANYNNQAKAVDDAVAALAAFYPGRIFKGANLHDALGRTGNMGGQRCTGGVAGTTLTVSAIQANSGSGIAVGQRVWNGQTLVGIISALGTGNGGTGTYTLDRAAAVAAGTTLVCAGMGMQYDGVHQTGLVVRPGAAAISDSLKAILAQR